jgi:DNA topoisomerase-1
LLESAKIEQKRTQRVVFHEITEPAIADAFAHPRGIDMDLVDAQQARRILDRLVGYNLSPLLWRKVRSRLSAGRVQSVALRLIVEREREIDAFNPVEYWSIAAELRPEKLKETFVAKLAKVDDADPVLGNQAEVQPILVDMEASTYVISKIKRGERRRAIRPFTTSTMQQEASPLGLHRSPYYGSGQQLYEGINWVRCGLDHLYAPTHQRRRINEGSA